MKSTKGGVASKQGSNAGGPPDSYSSSKSASRLAFFDHLPRKVVIKNDDLIDGDRILHPATIKLGGLYNKGIVQSDDDRVTALIGAFCGIIRDYKTPPKKILREDMDRYISKQVQHLVESRQISKGMGNLIKYIRHSISRIPPETSEADAKSILLTRLQTFLEERILFAAESIGRYVTSAIKDGDVVLTYGSSPLIRKILLTVSNTRSFRVVVIDARPLNEGLSTLTALSHKVHCVYSPLSGAAAAMKDQNVSVVLLGSSCLLSNGSLLAPAGTAMVACLAKAQQIPVIVASESYKFSEKVQLDSIVYNELGDSSEIAVMAPTTTDAAGATAGGAAAGATAANAGSSKAGSGDGSSASGFVPVPQLQPGYRGTDPSGIATTTGSTAGGAAAEDDETKAPRLPFSVVNLRYDLTPISNISVVATEAGLIPPTSIPVLMREILSDLAITGSAT